MENIVLMVVDVQNALIEEHPCNEADFTKNIQKLIQSARQNNVEVVYVRHDGGIGDELARNTKGWEIYHEIAPKSTDRIFDKCYNSAFKDTNLHKYLNEKGITSIILVGMQTEYCIDATCKVAFEYGYNIIIPQATTATYDNGLFSGEALVKYYEQKIWNRRFAKVLPVNEVIKQCLCNIVV